MKEIIVLLFILFLSCTSQIKNNKNAGVTDSIISNKKDFSDFRKKDTKNQVNYTNIKKNANINITKIVNDSFSDFKIGIINDLDGYTNIRKKPVINSEIVGKIIKNEKFLFNEYNKQWSKILKLNKLKGFMYSNRIREIKDKTLLYISIFEEGYDEENFKDTIISYNHLNANILIRDLNYPKFKLIKKPNNLVEFSNNKLKVEISKEAFQKENHYIVFDKNGNCKSIDNTLPYGVEISIPKFSIKDILIESETGKKIKISSLQYKDLFEPNLNSVNVYQPYDNLVIIWMTNGDAAGSYSVLFFIDIKNEIIKRYIYRAF